jgi:hypothetical protein
MNPESDADLRERFVAQRRAEREAAPVWNPRVLVISERLPISWRLSPWLPKASACVLLALTAWYLGASSSSGDLAKDLPEFFVTDGSPLFAGVDRLFAMPSDFLLPTHLHIQLP